MLPLVHIFYGAPHVNGIGRVFPVGVEERMSAAELEEFEFLQLGHIPTDECYEHVARVRDIAVMQRHAKVLAWATGAVAVFALIVTIRSWTG